MSREKGIGTWTVLSFLLKSWWTIGKSWLDMIKALGIFVPWWSGYDVEASGAGCHAKKVVWIVSNLLGQDLSLPLALYLWSFFYSSLLLSVKWCPITSTFSEKKWVDLCKELEQYPTLPLSSAAAAIEFMRNKGLGRSLVLFVGTV